MNSANGINFFSLFISSSLVLIALFFSYSQKLKLEKEILIGVFRAILQLILVGYLLNYIFGLKSPVFTTFLLLFMTFNASYNAAKRGKGIKNGFFISFLSISTGALITLFILVFSGAIQYEPYQIIPVGGMIISNAMVALGLCYRQLLTDFKNKREEVETKLSLGADIRTSSMEIIRDCIKVGMLPMIDSAKTLGIVSLPGMMTGLILAGTSPIEAVKYQIMVTFMMISTTSISSFIACYLAYKGFFNERKQLI
ncbi:ABC transporter permease [Garciella nitratireducens]|uniref:Putative ABC transport system permease protein n=1 Tax=Garciella nitratireducens DSM 15102 TaxID=1121911 RepID=A0A1T4L277_9FIRM|nr:iron export ABC transporter permease subunit FetB [Garciella nitratireducens]RBP40647.1 putative ABC transport system permease protein [Garciella nitratireducens]SJZ48753.1 putative ABC transport system permease protein [Garciella nitratireducens DSM 15102]